MLSCFHAVTRLRLVVDIPTDPHELVRLLEPFLGLQNLELEASGVFARRDPVHVTQRLCNSLSHLSLRGEGAPFIMRWLAGSLLLRNLVALKIKFSRGTMESALMPLKTLLNAVGPTLTDLRLVATSSDAWVVQRMPLLSIMLDSTELTNICRTCGSRPHRLQCPHRSPHPTPAGRRHPIPLLALDPPPAHPLPRSTTHHRRLPAPHAPAGRHLAGGHPVARARPRVRGHGAPARAAQRAPARAARPRPHPGHARGGTAHPPAAGGGARGAVRV